MLELVKFTKTGGPLTKRISLAPDGTLVSDGSACVMTRGTAERVKIADIDELATLIGSLHPSQAIALGALRDGLPDEVRIVTKKKLNGQANTIARTRDEILYRENCQALVLLDFDRGGMPADIADRLKNGFWAVLMEVVPDLRHAARLIRASTSAGLFNSDTGESLGGSGGLHGYVIARDGADAERFLTALHDRCWLHGLGWIKLGAAGQMLDRSIIDRSVAAPERLVFEAPPILTKPLGQDQESRRPIVHDGEVLDTLAACPSLTAEEQRRVEQLKAAARERIKPEAERVHEAYVDREAEEIVARTGISKKAAVAQVRSRCRGVLAVDAVLPFADKELEGCTVGDVLADPERFNGRVLADPIEGVSYGRTTAMVMLRRSDGYPWIKSFAHGGMSYTLGHGAAPPYSEEALALAFAERHANTLRYVAEWGQWLIWDGTCWRMDRTRQVFTLARELCREVAPKANKPSERKRIASAKTRAAVVSLAGEDRRLAATTEQWDADPWLLNTPDGVVDLHTGRLREHQATDYMTKQTAVSPKGECPRWMAFLQEVTGGDEALQRYLQRISGYFLTGVTIEQELYFFYGSGKNGKGVWTLSVSGILHDYHRSTSIETFTVAKSERHPTELAGLRGARLVTAAETEEGRRWAEARIKELTGGDKISARFMRQDFFDFFPQFKLLFLGNHMPTLRTVNKAITRRFNRIPFAVTIPDERVNKHLANELKAEWPGILAWAIEGCLEWQRIGLCPPKAVTDATESYLESEDILGEWIDECCIRDANAWESSTALFNSWKGWAVGREEWIGSVKTFSARLEDRGEFKKRRNPEKTKHGFAGLRLKVTAEKGAAAKGAAESAAKIDNLIPLRPSL